MAHGPAYRAERLHVLEAMVVQLGGRAMLLRHRLKTRLSSVLSRYYLAIISLLPRYYLAATMRLPPLEDALELGTWEIVGDGGS